VIWHATHVVPVLAAVLALFAVTDWVAVWRDNRRVEAVAKPLVMVALGALALALGAGGTGRGGLILIALFFGLVGDVFLLRDTEFRFMAGLVAFLLGHLAYVGAFLSIRYVPLFGVLGAVVVLVVIWTAGRRILRAVARDEPRLGPYVSAYMVVIAAMVVTAWATGLLLVALGGTVFMVSDTLLALDRFARPATVTWRWARTTVMVTYHVGQVLMVVGALR